MRNASTKCMLVFLHVSLGCIRLIVCCCRNVCPAHDLCLVCAHVLKLAVLLLPPLATQTALYWLFEYVQSFVR